MSRAGTRLILFACLLCTGSGCGTFFNVQGEEPMLIGPAPARTIDPFGGVDNDIRVFARTSEHEPIFFVLFASDFSLSLAGDIITLPYTTYQTLYRWQNAMNLYDDKEKMKEEVSKHLTIGMPINDTTRIMVDSGFKSENGPLDMPSCFRWSIVKALHVAGSDIICVFLYEQDGKLSRIEVNCSRDNQLPVSTEGRSE